MGGGLARDIKKRGRDPFIPSLGSQGIGTIQITKSKSYGYELYDIRAINARRLGNCILVINTATVGGRTVSQRSIL